MKSGEEPAEKGGNFGEKWRRVGKRGGQPTPVASFWRLEQLNSSAPPSKQLQDCGSHHIQGNPSRIPTVSARKLAATLWELHHYNHHLHQMHHGGGAPLPRLRRPNNDQLYNERSRLEPHDPSPDSLDLPESSSSLRRHVAASLMQHRLTERNSRALQPVSPASYGSSMEIAPYNPAVTPTSSVELKGRNYSLRTSTELLKVLNRIWSLEEQHVSNVSLVKALKKELYHARLQIKELVKEQKSDRREMEELIEQISEDKAVRRNKEQDRIEAAMQSMRDELEDERKLRKRSESLHRKLARELHEVKTTLARMSKEMENEKRSRDLLEDLCDEFALGIRGYEKELHYLRQKSDEDWSERGDRDQLILHLSETWLDERMQMKLQAGETQPVVEKLSSEIEAFLHAKRISSSNVNGNGNGNRAVKDPTLRSSLESIPLNMAVSAPQEEDDSAGSDSNCFELEKTNVSTLKYQGNEHQRLQETEITKQNQAKKRNGSSEKGIDPSPSSLQVKFEERMAHAIANGETSHPIEDREQAMHGKTRSIPPKPENGEVGKESSSDNKYESEGINGLNPNQMTGNLIRNHYMKPENGSKQDHGTWRTQPSPVRHWTEKLPSRDHDASESSSTKLHPELKENTLKSKLFEARTRVRGPRSRLKASIFPSRKE